MEIWGENLNPEFAGNEVWRIAAFFGLVLAFPTHALFPAGDPKRAIAGSGDTPPAEGA